MKPSMALIQDSEEFLKPGKSIDVKEIERIGSRSEGIPRGLLRLERRHLLCLFGLQSLK
jgi:hypothetical protein